MLGVVLGVLILTGLAAATVRCIVVALVRARRRRHGSVLGWTSGPPARSPQSPPIAASGGDPSVLPSAAEWKTAERGRSIEQVARDLRRLRAAIRHDATDSALHQIAHRMAYDRLLVEACGLMQLPHGLVGEDVQGPDRDCERLLTEANLQAAGLRLSNELDRL